MGVSSAIFKISISPKNYHFSSLDWAFKLICEKSGLNTRQKGKGKGKLMLKLIGFFLVLRLVMSVVIKWKAYLLILETGLVNIVIQTMTAT